MILFAPRPIRYINTIPCCGWRVKFYSISKVNEYVSERHIQKAKIGLKNWFEKSKITTLSNYKIATLILHEGKEGCFAIVNWWVDENMLQHYVYLANEESEGNFVLFADNMIITCVWELEVLWFERNAWVKHVLMKNENPDFENYLLEQLNKY